MMLSKLEEMLELEAVSRGEEDLFTNRQELWHPPGGRGIYGGVVLAQCLGAAQKTVPAGFSVHSMTCYFLLAGDNQIPLEYSVQRLRDGKSFATRTVVANQNGNSICTTTLSFSRNDSGGNEPVRHASTITPWVSPPADSTIDPVSISLGAPQTIPVSIEDKEGKPQHKRIRAWIRAPTKIVNSGPNNEAHQQILCFLSDWIFLAGVPLSHGLWKFPDAILSLTTRSPLEGSDIGMAASLSHTVNIHEPLSTRADEWMLFEAETPWSGEGRGLVVGKMFSKDGILLATCLQEGVVRRREDLGKSEQKL